MALAQGCVVVGIAERRTALDCGRRHVALDGGELERQGCDRPRETGQGLRLETLDVDLDEAWRAMTRDERIERGDRRANAPGPGLPRPAGGAVGRRNERLRRGRHCRVVDVELELDHARAAADRDRLDRNRAIAAVDKLQRRDQRRLRLDRDHPCTEPAKGGDAVADMGADVEHQIARPHELAIEAVHRGAALAVAVIDPE